MTMCIHTIQPVRQLYTPHTQRQAQTAGTAKHSPSVLGRGGWRVCVCLCGGVELRTLSGHKSVYPPLASFWGQKQESTT